MKKYRYTLPYNMVLKVEAANETHARTKFAVMLHQLGKYALSGEMRRGVLHIEQLVEHNNE